MGTYGSTWQHGGYSGAGNVGELLGSLAGQAALICGNANTVFEELKEAERQMPNAVLFAVNDIGMYLNRVDHWVSLHADRLNAWANVRLKGDWEQCGAKTHTAGTSLGVTYHWSLLNPLFALSGYFAMQVAYLMGCAPIVLCGCPGDPTPRFFEATRNGFGYGGGLSSSDSNIAKQLRNEMDRLPEFKSIVKSMGGWTYSYFGGL